MSASSDERFNVWEVPFVAADNKKYKGRSDLNLSEDEINTRVADEQTCPALQLMYETSYEQRVNNLPHVEDVFGA